MLMEEEAKKSDVNLADTITKLAVSSKEADNVLKTVKVYESKCMNNEVINQRQREREKKKEGKREKYTDRHHHKAVAVNILYAYNYHICFLIHAINHF